MADYSILAKSDRIVVRKCFQDATPHSVIRPVIIEPPNLGSDYDPVARMLGEAPQTYRDGDAVFYLQECFSAIADGTPYWQATYVKRQKPPVREGSVSD